MKPDGTQNYKAKCPNVGLAAHLELFVKVRWIAAAATIIAITASNLAGIDLPYPWLYAVALSVPLYNAFFFFTRPRAPQPTGDILGSEEPCYESNRRNALAQIGLDLVALTLLVHGSGGLENPFILFYLFHVVIAGILLDTVYAFLVATFSSLLVCGLGLIEATGAIEHHSLDPAIAAVGIATKWRFVLPLLGIMTVTFFITASFAVVIMNERRRRREQIVALSRDLERKNRKLVRLDGMRRGLLAVASHDLKSPLAAVASQLMVLRDGYLGEISGEQKACVERCLRRLEGLTTLIGDVLSWSSIEKGELEQKMRPCDLGEVLRQTVESHAEQAAQKGLTLRSEIPLDLPEIIAAPERIAQVFENLLSNAIKYTQHGEVEVTARADADSLNFSFRDTGIGISKEDGPSLFTDFFRAQSVKKTIEGTGLGLSVVLRIVRAHGGRIRVESALGKGSKFTVVLPRQREPEDQPTDPSIYPPLLEDTVDIDLHAK